MDLDLLQNFNDRQTGGGETRVHVHAELRGTLTYLGKCNFNGGLCYTILIIASVLEVRAGTSQKTEYMHIPPTLNQRPRQTLYTNYQSLKDKGEQTFIYQQ